MGQKDKELLSETESVCPECLSRIPAAKLAVGHDVYLEKACPGHGKFSVIIWRGEPFFSSWTRNKIPCYPSAPSTEIARGCPFDCGLCPEHRQQTCTALLEITNRCNLKCAYCFADSGKDNSSDPEISVIRSWYGSLLASGHPSNIQLSGGEPTVRDDLPEVIAMGRSMGFRFIQLNTNGIRLANEPSYVEELKEAGLASVFLQFDGTNDEIFRAIRGRKLFETKLQAIRNCERQGLGVILVPTLVPRVNINNIGNIIQFALENISVVRGVHFQPVSYFGRYPEHPADSDRLTLPELMRNLEHQTAGIVKSLNFTPPGCENALCSFHGNFVLMPDGKLTALTRHRSTDLLCKPETAEAGASSARRFVSSHWAAPPENAAQKDEEMSLGDWDVLLERSRTHMICISAMVFQDAWNLDLERLRDCCIHVVSNEGKIIPFCAYNLTSSHGSSVYRKGL